MLLSVRQFVAAFWLAMILLVVASVPMSGQQSGSSYDPWLDYNGDGTINAADLSSMAQAYGTEGEPIKNVTIIGHATRLIRAAVNVVLPQLTSWDSGLIWTDGYAKMTILVYIYPSNSNKIEIYTHDYTGLTGPSWLMEQISSFGNSWVKTYDVSNQQLRIVVSNPFTGSSCTLNVDVYLMA